MSLRKVFREPLIHFAVIGGAIFLAYSALNTDAPTTQSGRTIVVDESALIDFMQNRTRVFEPEAQRMRLESMSEDEVALLTEDYVREEVFFREAEALDLDGDDYIIKRRMVQKMEFIASAAIARVDDITEEDVDQYFKFHVDEYFIDPHISFTHIFFDSEMHGKEAARELADDAMATLAAGEELPTGNRFPYAKNYIERVKPLIADHFGIAMADAVWALEPGEAWHGPFESPYGYHLVRVYERRDGRIPELDEVIDLVREDALAARQRDAMERAANDTIERYDVRIEYSP